MPPAASTPVTIWHNPRCSKSRETLALLRERGIEPVIRAYLEQPPTAKEIDVLLTQLGGAPHLLLLRDNEEAFKATGRTAASLDPHDVSLLIARHPILLQRPVVVAGGRAAIGRPPAAVLALVRKS